MQKAIIIKYVSQFYEKKTNRSTISKWNRDVRNPTNLLIYEKNESENVLGFMQR